MPNNISDQSCRNSESERWKEVFQDWRDSFPYLKPLGRMRLMYRTDICLIGLFLEKGKNGGWYRVEFEVKPLWDDITDNTANCYQYPVLEDINRHYTDYFISFDYNMREDSHHRDFKRASESTREQFGEVLEGIAESGFLLEKCDEAHIKIKFYDEWYCQRYHEFKLAMALYLNDTEMRDAFYYNIEEELREKQDKVESYLKQRRIWHRLKCILPKYRKKWLKDYRWDIDNLIFWMEWKRRIDEKFHNRDHFMSLCEANSKLRKIRRLNKGEIVHTPYHEPVRLKKSK